jgi:hypothetical protein
MDMDDRRFCVVDVPSTCVSGVPPGSYELQVVPPPMFSARYHQSKIELRDSRSCSVADFFL